MKEETVKKIFKTLAKIIETKENCKVAVTVKRKDEAKI